MIEFARPTPHPSASASARIFFYLLIFCQLHKGVKDPVSFTVTTGLLGRLGLGLRVRVSIRIIFTSIILAVDRRSVAYPHENC